MVIPSHSDMIAAIDAFLIRHPEIGDAKFGRSATGEPGLLQRLRAGSSPTLRVMTKIRDFMVAADAIEACDGVHGHMDTDARVPSSCGKADEVSAGVSA